MRNLFKAPALLLSLAALLIALGAAVSATAQSDRESRSERPSQAQPVPDQSTVQGAQTPSNQSATPPSQAAPQAGATSSAQANRAPGQTDIEDELQLTPDQKQQISAIVDDENRQISTVRDDQNMTMDQKIEKVQEIRKNGAPKIKAVLTPEQLQKLSVLQERARQQQQQQSQPPQNQAPAPPKQ